MRRIIVIITGLAMSAIVGAIGYRLSANWKDYRYSGTRLMTDLGKPDAMIRTSSLARLPRDLLKVPIARDVLTEDLVFYYEQNEDRLGLNGAVKRIAYEHQLSWTDKILVSVFSEPAEVAFWRDGKGALRHFALVIKRNTLAKVLQEAAKVAMKDGQLKLAGEISTDAGKAQLLALELNPRRTMLIVAQGERVVVLSDPGMLLDQGGQVAPAARDAVAQWLQGDGVLSRQFALEETKGVRPNQPAHTMVIGASTLALGYGAFVPGFRGIRLDYQHAWTTSVWLEPQLLHGGKLGERALWQAAPANPGACVVMPVDWRTTENILNLADNKPALSEQASLALLEGPALVCWYGDSALYAPVFIGRLTKGIKDRNLILQALAAWAFKGEGGADAAAAKARAKLGKDTLVWRAAAPEGKDKAGGDKPQFTAPSIAAAGDYLVFSPDRALVDLVLDTLARKNPSVADQMPATHATVALITPRRLSTMAEREALDVLERSDDANLRQAAQIHLPPRMRALAKYPPYRLDVAAGKPVSGWQRVEWRTPEEGK